MVVMHKEVSYSYSELVPSVLYFSALLSYMVTEQLLVPICSQG